MKVWVFSYYDKKDIERMVSLFADLRERNPEFVITYGGDGTILDAERRYPGIPKIPIKKTKICSKCMAFGASNIDHIMDKLRNREFKIKEETKVEAEFKGKKITGLNEIQVTHRFPNKALRFSVNGGEEIIGDGVVVATPYGSTGYYRAMGNEPFQDGIRIGFNNTMKKFKPMRVKGDVKIKVLREWGLLLADNDSDMIKLKPGDTVIVKKSKNIAKFIEI